MDWGIFVNFGNVWYWVGVVAGGLGIVVGLFAFRVAAVLLRWLKLGATEDSLDRIAARLPGLEERTKAINIELAEPQETYEVMLHRNYHIATKFGPVPGCQFCPQQPKQ